MIDIYTCITAGYDDLKKQPVQKGVRYAAFVEGVTRPLPPWKIYGVPPAAEEESDPTRRARKLKALAHKILPEAEYSLWVDGCFLIRPDFRIERFIRLMGDRDILTFQHPRHDCTYEHAEGIVKFGLDRSLTVAAQMLRYREAGFPEHAGMVQTNVLLRRHTEAVRRFNEKWWEEIRAGSRRDQLSFVYAAKETGVPYVALPMTEAVYFQGKSHRGARTKL